MKAEKIRVFLCISLYMFTVQQMHNVVDRARSFAFGSFLKIEAYFLAVAVCAWIQSGGTGGYGKCRHNVCDQPGIRKWRPLGFAITRNFSILHTLTGGKVRRICSSTESTVEAPDVENFASISCPFSNEN